MDEESAPDGPDHRISGVAQPGSGISPRKTIAPERDRSQSRLLTLSLCTVLPIALLVSTSPYAGGAPVSGSLQVLAFSISAAFALAVLRLRAATPGGAISGGIICALLILWTAAPPPSARQPSPRIFSPVLHSALTPLALLFICTFVATRLGRARKAVRGLAESRRGRSTSQVLANLAAAALCASLCGIVSSLRFAPHTANADALALAGRVLSLAALAEATADTVSSEVGQAFGGQPRMLLSLRRVPPGTDGAITTLGSVAGITAGVAIALSGQWAMGLTSTEAAAAATGGIFGLFFDSLLGATAERRGWLGNDLVNFSSTAVAALVASILNRLLHP